jgi:hypothetical protein
LCSALRSICIPSSVEILCAYCFGLCTSLSRLTFERNSRLVEIQRGAFEGCSSLKSIGIPDSVEIYNRPMLDWRGRCLDCSFVLMAECSLKRLRVFLGD